MSDELKAPAERRKSMHLTAQAVKLLHRDDEPETAEMASTKAAVKLADLVLADLAAREAEERERALPIDEVWLRPLCRSVSTQEAFWFIDEDIFLVRWAGGFNLKMNNREIAQQATRGDLLDLLAGLKINTKGGAE